MQLPDPSLRVTVGISLVHYDLQIDIELENLILCQKLWKLDYVVFHSLSTEDPD